MTATTTTLSTEATCELAGITFRQLDYLARTIPELTELPTVARGSGSRRRWDLDTVTRITVAATLSRVVTSLPEAGESTSPLRSLTCATMRGPTPPIEGYAAVSATGTMTYRRSLWSTDEPELVNGWICRAYDIVRAAQRALDRVQEFGRRGSPHVERELRNLLAEIAVPA